METGLNAVNEIDEPVPLRGSPRPDTREKVSQVSRARRDPQKVCRLLQCVVVSARHQHRVPAARGDLNRCPILVGLLDHREQIPSGIAGGDRHAAPSISTTYEATVVRTASGDRAATSGQSERLHRLPRDLGDQVECRSASSSLPRGIHHGLVRQVTERFDRPSPVLGSRSFKPST